MYFYCCATLAKVSYMLASDRHDFLFSFVAEMLDDLVFRRNFDAENPENPVWRYNIAFEIAPSP